MKGAVNCQPINCSHKL